MSLPWRKDKRPHLRLVRIEEKLDELIQLEKGMIPVLVSNDPTEIEITNGRKLHSWTSAVVEDGAIELKCFYCGVLIVNCGATEDSWYCTNEN